MEGQRGQKGRGTKGTEGQKGQRNRGAQGSEGQKTEGVRGQREVWSLLTQAFPSKLAQIGLSWDCPGSP